jgi:hypothetical protein
MTDETQPIHEPLELPTRAQVRSVWILASAAGALVGAMVAMGFFPDAGFARNPTGHFGWNLVGFALSIGLPLGTGQALALRYLLRGRGVVRKAHLALWVLITGIAIGVMIFPLWSWYAMTFVAMPPLVAVPMLPGAVCLAVSQWLLLRRLIPVRAAWIYLTVAGAFGGGIAGLIVGLFPHPMPVPMELTWASTAAAGIGALQAIELVRALDPSRGTGNRRTRWLVVAIVSAVALLVLYFMWISLAGMLFWGI